MVTTVLQQYDPSVGLVHQTILRLEGDGRSRRGLREAEQDISVDPLVGSCGVTLVLGTWPRGRG